MPIVVGRRTLRPIPAEVMRSQTEPLRPNCGVRRDFAALVRTITVRVTQEAAHGLELFQRPTLSVFSSARAAS